MPSLSWARAPHLFHYLIPNPLVLLLGELAEAEVSTFSAPRVNSLACDACTYLM